MGVLHPFPATKAHNLAAALLERHSAQEIADAIEVLIDVLDALGGDPDLEDNNDREASDGDDKDFSWPKSGAEVRNDMLGVYGRSEDDEDDDPAGQCDEDGVNTAFQVLAQEGAGCVISDEDFAPNWPMPTYGVDQTHIERMPE